MVEAAGPVCAWGDRFHDAEHGMHFIEQQAHELGTPTPGARHRHSVVVRQGGPSMQGRGNTGRGGSIVDVPCVHQNEKNKMHE
jgi:hypothetical protein